MEQSLCDKSRKTLSLVSDMAYQLYVEFYVFRKHSLTYIPAVNQESSFPLSGTTANYGLPDSAVFSVCFVVLLSCALLHFAYGSHFPCTKHFILYWSLTNILTSIDIPAACLRIFFTLQ